jgi:integrase
VVRPRKAKIPLPPHINAVTARGKEYYYFHPARGTSRSGKAIRISGEPVSADGTLNAAWWEAYRRMAGEGEPVTHSGTFLRLVESYQESPEWDALAPRTREEWARHFKYVVSSWGKLQVEGVEPRHVLALRDSRAKTPADANNLLRALSSLLAWSVPRGWRSDNPCREVRKLKGGEGYAPWPWDTIQHLRIEARRDLWYAAALALYSGQRQSDVLGMTWNDVKDGLIAVKQGKTKKHLWIPVHRDLATVLVEMPRRSVRILTNSRGRPWTADGFRVSWRVELMRPQMEDLRAKRLVFHGLRKSAVVMLLEAGATDAEVAAITGQSREMVAHYSRQVSQRKLAAAAILKWETAAPGVPSHSISAHTENESLQNTTPVLAKPNAANKTKREEDAESKGEIGAGEGNRTLDTQLGKRLERRYRRISLDGAGQISG